MLVNTFDKPKTKKKRHKRNPMPAINSKCSVCSRGYAETHEVMFGTGQRHLSIKYGIQELLCYEHHRGLLGPHRNRMFDLELKQKHQRRFELLHGHTEWMKVFGKSYLDRTIEESLYELG